MDFYTVLSEVEDLLRSRGRVSYRALKVQYALDDERIGALREELLYAHPGKVVEDGQGLVWTAGASGTPDAERRQLTVMFCDVVGSTPLASQFDPEEWREVMRAYYETCEKVIARFDGHVANYLGDGLLVYFGYPRAHEDDAQRAVRAGLGIVEAVGQLNAVLAEKHGVSLAVRLGCHTGLVVVGELVRGMGHDDMVLGDTPNIAARLQGIAAPNTLVIGALTHQLVGGFFDCQSLGTPPLKGVATPLEVFQVLNESPARTRLEALGATGLTPLVGRQAEVQLLDERWAQVLDGRGQVVVINGEAGIGKSRLVHALTEHAAAQQAWLTPVRDRRITGTPRSTRSSIFSNEWSYASSAPSRRPTSYANWRSSSYRADYRWRTHCLISAPLLSIPPDARHEFPDLPPDQQKQQTMLALQSILRRRAAQQPVLFVVEDLHWVDPTTVEFLTQLIEQIHEARILALFTCRPEFRNPWTGGPTSVRSTSRRLPPTDATELIRRVAGGKTLPDEIVADVVTKTDGVPLFIEELTKTVLESGLVEEESDRYQLAGPLPPLAIPNTLHDSLMARLDRLSTIKALAQLSAAIGREFSVTRCYEPSPRGVRILCMRALRNWSRPNSSTNKGHRPRRRTASSTP